MTHPFTRNPGHGFFGTMQDHAARAWPLAVEAIVDATGDSPEDARTFLDSSFGRHFADEVLDHYNQGGVELSAAIAWTTETWQARRVGVRTARHFGVPGGLSHLQAFVVAAVIAEEAAE